MHMSSGEEGIVQCQTAHLDVGCGSKPRNPYGCDRVYGVDIIDQEADGFHYRKCNVLLEKLPFDDATFDSVSCYDFLEHISRLVVADGFTRFPFVEFMNEVHRVLKPGGLFYALTPYYPREEAFVDPTHVNIITRNTHTYFTSPDYGAAVYGFTGKFTVVMVKETKLSWESRRDAGLKALLHRCYQAVAVHKKSHLLWVFTAV